MSPVVATKVAQYVPTATNKSSGRVKVHRFPSSISIESKRKALAASRVVPRRCTVRASAENESTKTSTTVSMDLKKNLDILDTKLAVAVDEGEGAQAEAQALRLVEDLREQGVLRVFNQGRGVPKQVYSLADLKLNNIDAAALLSPEDSTLNGVRDVATWALAAGVVAATWAFQLEPVDLLKLGFSLFLAKSVDQVVNGGGLEALLLDSVGRVISSQYKERVALHEAGHFLTAYLVGVLPKGYTLSSLDALNKYNALNVQAGTVFCDREFQKEVSTGRITSSYVDRFSCIALAGVATEYLRFGQAEGGLSDVNQLDQLMRALQFTQKKSDAQVRWAVLNTIAMLRLHKDAHTALAKAMSEGATVGRCIQVIEECVDLDQLSPLVTEVVDESPVDDAVSKRIDDMVVTEKP